MFGRYLFGKYPRGDARITSPPIPPDDPFPTQIAVVPGPKRSVLVAAMLGAMFVHQGIIEPEFPPLPEGSIQITVPLFSQKPGYAAITNPPFQVQDIYGSTSILLNDPPYKWKTHINTRPLDEPPTPTDELFPSSRRIYTPIRPYKGKTFTHGVPFDEPPPDGDIAITLYLPEYLGKPFVKGIPFVEPAGDERVESREASYQPIRPYRSARWTQGIPPRDIDELLQGRRSAYLPLRPYAGKSFVQTPPFPEIEDLRGAQSVYNPLRPYRGAPFINGIPPKEIDELESGRRSVYLPIRPYLGKPWIQRIPFPEIIVNEAPELHPDIRVNLSAYRPHHRGQSFAGFIERPNTPAPVLDFIKLYVMQRMDVTFYVEPQDEIELHIRLTEDTDT